MTTQAQPTARTANPTPEVKPFKCPHCKAILGETNGTSLRFCGVVAFPFPVTMSCLSCGGMVKWRPVFGSNGGCKD